MNVEIKLDREKYHALKMSIHKTILFNIRKHRPNKKQRTDEPCPLQIPAIEILAFISDGQFLLKE